jgi:hypothetical protein
VSRATCAGMLLAAAVLLASGCGSTELSDAQLRAHATRVCRNATIQTDRIPTPTSPAGGAAFLERGIAVLEPEYQRLRALRPPSDLAQVYAIPVSTFSRKLDAMKSAAHRLEHGGDPAITMKTLQRRLAPLESSEQGAWAALQVPACASS